MTGFRVPRCRATTAVLATAFPWHNGAAIRGVGPIIGVDLVAGNAPFGMDLFAWKRAGLIKAPNMVVVGEPGVGKSALLKLMLGYMAGAFGSRLIITDPKGEYRALADALGLPILNLRPGAGVRVNPLDDVDGRLVVLAGIVAIAAGRSTSLAERGLLDQALRMIPGRPQLIDVVKVLRDLPDALVCETNLTREEVARLAFEPRVALEQLLSSDYGEMFVGETNTSLVSPRGFVVDVSGAGRDNKKLALATLLGMRAADQVIALGGGQTVQLNDEAWRLGGNRDSMDALQHSVKMGRQLGVGNVLAMHRLKELGDQADDATSRIAGNVVNDSEVKVMFRAGSRSDAQDHVSRLSLPEHLVDILVQLRPHRCLVYAGGRMAMVDVVLSARMREICDTDVAMREHSAVGATT